MFYVYAFLFWLKCKTRKGNRLGSVNMTVSLPYGFFPRRGQVEIFESDLYPHYDHFPKRGVRNKVYIDSHTRDAWCWIGDGYSRMQIPIAVIEKLDVVLDGVFIYQTRSDFPTYGRMGNFYFDTDSGRIWRCIGNGYIEVKGQPTIDLTHYIKPNDDWEPKQGELFIRPFNIKPSSSELFIKPFNIKPGSKKLLFSDALLKEHLSQTVKNIPTL